MVGFVSLFMKIYMSIYEIYAENTKQWRYSYLLNVLILE